ncbi:hypothetical protein QBC38DRAFT_47126 [Podospora fimiseda]|uniref:Uncharacterized protein n=1 Tax=Podospora fimiseda TaxID=252190 RepID=A0AAN7BVC1_9PEZI|nr:hypothetical protein QBC38DRAFT_47126 [Podospora fimiseda]
MIHMLSTIPQTPANPQSQPLLKYPNLNLNLNLNVAHCHRCLKGPTSTHFLASTHLQPGSLPPVAACTSLNNSFQPGTLSPLAPWSNSSIPSQGPPVYHQLLPATFKNGGAPVQHAVPTRDAILRYQAVNKDEEGRAKLPPSVTVQLGIVRDNPDVGLSPEVGETLEVAIETVWDKVLDLYKQSNGEEIYLMSDNEYGLFNYFQNRFENDENHEIAKKVRVRYWEDSIKDVMPFVRRYNLPHGGMFGPGPKQPLKQSGKRRRGGDKSDKSETGESSKKGRRR